MKRWAEEYWKKGIEKRIQREYDHYAKKHNTYTQTSKELAELSGMLRCRIVVDLGTGTGATAKYLLKRSKRIRRIYCIDFSKEALSIAKKNIGSGKAKFIVCKAEDFSRHLNEKADGIISNATFQYVDLDQVLKEARKVLVPEGIIAFTIWPVWLKGMKQDRQFISFFKAFYSNMNSIARKKGFKCDFDYRFELGAERGIFSAKAVAHSFSKNGFRQLRRGNLSVNRTPNNFLDFLKLYNIAKYRLPDVPMAERGEILDEAMRQTVKKLGSKAILHRWPYFVARVRG